MKLRKGSITLIIGEFFDRLNFYGIQSVLLLYLIKVFFFSQNNAITIYGIYSSLGFITPIIGGYFADKFLSRHRFILLGILFIVGGDCLLLFGSENMLFLGLSSIVTGISFFKSNNAVLFGSLYDQMPDKKDAAFTFYYAAMNSGAIAGPFIYGTLAMVLGWRFGFAASMIGFAISLTFYLLRLKLIRKIDEKSFERFSIVSLKILLLCMALFYCVYLSFKYSQFFVFLIWGSGVLVIGLVLYLIKPLTKNARKKVILLMICMCAGLFFYAVSLQVSSSLLLYINADVKTKILGFTIPPQYFMSIYPLFIILSTPLIAKVWTQQTSTNSRTLIQRVNLSLYLATASFLIMAGSTLFTHTTMNWQIILILVGLFVLGLGELAIGPIVTSAVTYLSPGHRHGIFMGLWYLLIGYSAYISSVIAKMVSLPNHLKHGSLYLQTFSIVAAITLIIAIAMTLMSKHLRNLCPN